MRLVIDTNIFVSALLLPRSTPAQLVRLWTAGRFDVVTAMEQLDEIARVTRYPKVRERLRPAVAGRLVNQLRHRATLLADLPLVEVSLVEVSPDPYDNYLLALAGVGKADLLVTGDKRDLLALKRHDGALIVTARAALEHLY